MGKYLQMEYHINYGTNPETNDALIIDETTYGTSVHPALPPVVTPGEAVRFDHVLASSGYENIATPSIPPKDFFYDPASASGGDYGVITFNQAGLYYVNWWVAQKTGLSKDGERFTLYVKIPTVRPADYDNDRDGDFDKWFQYTKEGDSYVKGEAITFVPYAEGKSHLKVCSSTGFALINAVAGTEGMQIKLVNAADRPATLSHFPGAKAGIAIFGLDDTPDEFHIDAIHVQVKNPGDDITFAESTNGIHYGWGHEIAADEAIPFDTTLEWINTHIMLTDLGQITIGEDGYYMVTWEVPYNATDLADFVHLALFLDEDKKADALMPMPIGAITGTAIVWANAGSILSLKNVLTEDTVRIMQYANLTVTRIPDLKWYGKRNPLDGIDGRPTPQAPVSDPYPNDLF